MADQPTPPADQSAQGQGATGTQSRISDEVRKKYPDLEDLINQTESMTTEEREYWFQILPIMTDDQVNRLKNILTEEAEQLAKLDKQYQDELTKLNKKHLEEWDTFEKQQEREARRKEEAAHEEEEAAAEEELLKKLEGEE